MLFRSEREKQKERERDIEREREIVREREAERERGRDIERERDKEKEKKFLWLTGQFVTVKNTEISNTNGKLPIRSDSEDYKKDNKINHIESARLCVCRLIVYMGYGLRMKDL